MKLEIYNESEKVFYSTDTIIFPFNNGETESNVTVKITNDKKYILNRADIVDINDTVVFSLLDSILYPNEYTIKTLTNISNTFSINNYRIKEQYGITSNQYAEYYFNDFIENLTSYKHITSGNIINDINTVFTNEISFIMKSKILSNGTILTIDNFEIEIDSNNRIKITNGTFTWLSSQIEFNNNDDIFYILIDLENSTIDFYINMNKINGELTGTLPQEFTGNTPILFGGIECNVDYVLMYNQIIDMRYMLFINSIR